MYLKIVIASLIVSLLAAAIAHFAGLSAMLSPYPQFLTHFAIALPAALIASAWACSWNGAGSRRRPSGVSRPAAANPSVRKETGSVKWFSPSKGFGFITRDNGDDIFVHFRSIMGNGHRVLREGQRVEFAVTEGAKGLQAEEVSAIE